MSRLIDADELSKVKFHPLPYTHIVPNGENAESYERGWNDAIDAIISDAPTVDAVPVVRCKDCKHYPEEDHGYIRFPDDICPCKCDDDYYNRVPKPEWFCANGEKVME